MYARLRAKTVLAIFVLTLTGCSKSEKSATQNIATQLKSGSAQVDMRDISGFAWDHMFIFGPYYPKDEICKKLELTTPECSKAGIFEGARYEASSLAVGEGEALLVFLHGPSVSRVESIPRTIANFDESCLDKKISKGAAVFQVTQPQPGVVYLVCH